MIGEVAYADDAEGGEEPDRNGEEICCDGAEAEVFY